MGEFGSYTPFTIPRVYQPRQMPFLLAGLLFLLVGAGFAASFLREGPWERVPAGFWHEGGPRGWVPGTLWNILGPSAYGAVWLAAAALGYRITVPRAPAPVLPPTPWEGVRDHLNRALAASLIALTGAYTAFLAMAIQIAVVFVARGERVAGEARGFNNTWFMVGLLAYLMWAGLMLLAFNRDAKRAQYGDRALEAGVELPPARTPADRYPRPAKPTEPPVTGTNQRQP
ncbi:MAG TPA: hypothetical protein VEI97_16490, partial [bacterium]|nr:hypothetical protein [bacterium]